MAEITKPANVSVCSFNPPPSAFPTYGKSLNNPGDTGPGAGETIAAGDNCYLKSDGSVWRSTGAAANAAARVRGQAARGATAGEPVTLCRGLRFGGFTGLTPGADYYLSGTIPGGLADAASTGGTVPVAFVANATTVEYLRAN